MLGTVNGDGIGSEREVGRDLTRLLLATTDELVGGTSLAAEMWASAAIAGLHGAPLTDDDLRAVLRHAVARALLDAGDRTTDDDRQTLAVLLALAAVSSGPLVDELRAAAVLVRSLGVDPPAWAEQIGKVEVVGCWRFMERAGDLDSVIAAFRYPQEAVHMLFVHLDPNLLGAGVDGWVAPDATTAIGYFTGPPPADDGTVSFAAIEPVEAHALLAAAISGSADLPSEMTTEMYQQCVGLLRSRLRALPPAAELSAPEPWEAGRRQQILDEFLGSEQAARFLANPEAGEHADDVLAACACAFIRFGATIDGGRPLRVTPIKCENFLLRWLRHETISFDSVLDLVPLALSAYTDWAVDRDRLPAAAAALIRKAILASVPELHATFAQLPCEGSFRWAFDCAAAEGLAAFHPDLTHITAWREAELLRNEAN
jgi:hypothetical protein